MEKLYNYREFAKRVREIVRKYDKEARIYVFGSVVKGSFTALSDIDILIVTGTDKKTKHRIMTEVYSEIDAPIELHFATEDQFKNWYLRFIKEDELVEIT